MYLACVDGLAHLSESGALTHALLLQYLGDKKMDNSQEVTVVHFLLGLCKQLDAIDESRYALVMAVARSLLASDVSRSNLPLPASRVMPLIIEKRIFSLLAMHLSMNIHLLSVSPDSQVRHWAVCLSFGMARTASVGLALFASEFQCLRLHYVCVVTVVARSSRPTLRSVSRHSRC